MDACSRMKVSKVQGETAQPAVKGHGERVAIAKVPEEGRLGADGAAGQLEVGRVVVDEDVANAVSCRRCHRGRSAARLHASRRRRTRRCEAAWRKLEEGRKTAAAAPTSPLRSSLWTWALSVLRWRRVQAVWTAWMAECCGSDASEHDVPTGTRSPGALTVAMTGELMEPMGSRPVAWLSAMGAA